MAEIDINALHLADTLSKNPKLQKLLQSPDLRGHRLPAIQGEKLREFLLFSTMAMMELGAEKLSCFLEALVGGKPLSEPIPVGNINDCSECDESVTLESNGATVRATVECPCPQGPIVVLLNVPSGEMVYSGHLEELFPIPDFNINYRIGIIETSQAMEQAGCAVGYVGDNYCIVDSVNANGFKIIKLLPDYTRMHLPDGTFGDEDSPFYTFVDAGEYERRGGRKDNNVWHLKVRPGVYQFSHTLPDHNLIDEPFEFATVVWVREPDPMQREV